jgi:hypothetical protein
MNKDRLRWSSQRWVRKQMCQNATYTSFVTRSPSLICARRRLVHLEIFAGPQHPGIVEYYARIAKVDIEQMPGEPAWRTIGLWIIIVATGFLIPVSHRIVEGITTSLIIAPVDSVLAAPSHRVSRPLRKDVQADNVEC